MAKEIVTPAARATGILGERLVRTEVRVDLLTETLSEWRKDFKEYASRTTETLQELTNAHHSAKGAWKATTIIVSVVTTIVTIGVNIAIKLLT